MACSTKSNIQQIIPAVVLAYFMIISYFIKQPKLSPFLCLLDNYFRAVNLASIVFSIEPYYVVWYLRIFKTLPGDECTCYQKYVLSTSRFPAPCATGNYSKCSPYSYEIRVKMCCYHARVGYVGNKIFTRTDLNQVVSPQPCTGSFSFRKYNKPHFVRISQLTRCWGQPVN